MVSLGEAGGALAGIRVVDLTRALAGPYCTLMLADHGADVVKIEIPGTGDETREWAPPHMNGISAYYLAINRNKRSVTLDLKHPDGKRVLERMIERADAVVENFSPGVLGRLGFPDDRVRAMNRRAILCHISGFGQDGPGRAWAAYDLVVHGQDRLAERQRRMSSELADHVPRVHRPRRRRGQIWASLTFHPLMASCWRIDDFYVDPLKSR